ncbi:conserved hypothetical protein [Ricinus communis]|uniref:Uncharacterized protein n=1 Tax=Ricinus communis TaxID=3988 RepID=B9RC81_RICCO|nr:conserved hypothetical protein [Ricinus communis]
MQLSMVHRGFQGGQVAGEWLVKTELTGNNGNLTPEEGARAPVRLALLPDDGPSGLYFDNVEASSF